MLCTELSSQIFYSLSIVMLFENSQKKVARLLLFLFAYRANAIKQLFHV